jgi:hypothetical protein
VPVAQLFGAAQLVWQHTPPMQWPLVHWLLPPQDPPSAILATHLLAWHHAVEAHCVSLVQLVRQAVEPQV